MRHVEQGPESVMQVEGLATELNSILDTCWRIVLRRIKLSEYDGREEYVNETAFFLSILKDHRYHAFSKLDNGHMLNSGCRYKITAYTYVYLVLRLDTLFRRAMKRLPCTNAIRNEDIPMDCQFEAEEQP